MSLCKYYRAHNHKPLTEVLTIAECSCVPSVGEAVQIGDEPVMKVAQVTHTLARAGEPHHVVEIYLVAMDQAGAARLMTAGSPSEPS